MSPPDQAGVHGEPGSTTVAVGGHRRVPSPDPVAHDYLLLALRLDQHLPGLVDGYFGPAEIKARADIEELRVPKRLVEDANQLLARIGGEVVESDRKGWLTAQVVALRAQAEVLAGVDLPYLELVEHCLARVPVRHDPSIFEDAAAAIDRLLPGPGHLADRLQAWDDRFVVPPDRILDVVTWLVERFRDRAERLFGLPDGEELRIRLVTKQPWSGYAWFDGGGRSRVDINTDLPIRAPDLIHVAAHESYPGHHLEHAWKEAELVDRRRRLEASILLINTPECLISEGLADLGHRFASPPDEEAALLIELCDRAGIAIAADPIAIRDAASTAVTLAAPRRILSESRVTAALMRHVDRASHETVLAWLVRVGRFSAATAAKQLEFIEHPLWRTYVFAYGEGQALLRRWLEAVPEADRAARFGRLLREQLTPSAIAGEAGQAPA